MKLKVAQEDVNKRLDKFLTEKIEDKTRSQIKKLVQDKQVFVNDEPVTVHQFLKLGDKVLIKKLETTKKQAIRKDKKIIAPKVIFENKEYLVIDKPVGLLVHPTGKGEINTLVDWLMKKYPKIKNIGQDQQRSGIVHRLDKDVSGIMVIAKTNKTFNHLKSQFKNREVLKHYTALVYGNTQRPHGEINLPIGRNKDGQFVAHPLQGPEKYQDKDKVAKTKYAVLEYIKDYTLLNVEILTGRTHQVRAHLSAIGHPILGDKIYQPKKKFLNLLRKRIKIIQLPRIFLHSTKLGFKDLKEEWQEFDSPLPKQLKQFLDEQQQ